MKKIALITMHSTTNFGSALQAFALYKTIQEQGYDIDILDYRCDAVEKKEKLIINFSDPRSIYRKIVYGKKYKNKIKIFEKFLNQYATISEMYTKDNVKEANSKYDVFISGSDIIWGLNVTGNDYTYFLDFVDNEKKKIAFSSSCGIRWDKKDEEKVKKLLLGYDDIAVRESLVADWIEEIINKRPFVVVDPTMLWNKEQWEKYAKLPKLKHERYILVYFTDPNRKNIKDAIALSKKLKIPVYYINSARPIKGTISIELNDVTEFIGIIKNAEYIFSASFHGLLFSLYFHREVFYYNRANFSRMESLAKWLEIEDHNGMNMNSFDSLNTINYSKVDEKINEKREESMSILREYLDRNMK